MPETTQQEYHPFANTTDTNFNSLPNLNTTMVEDSSFHQPILNTDQIIHNSYADFLEYTIRRGKLLLHSSLAFGRACPNLSFTRTPDFNNIILLIIKNNMLTNYELHCLKSVSSGINKLIDAWKLATTVPIDISSIKEPTVPRSQLTQQMMLLALHCDLSVPLILSVLRGEYTADYRDTSSIIRILQYHNCPEEIVNEVERIYTIGAPANFRAQSTQENFNAYLSYNNHKSAVIKPDIIGKLINKEVDRAYAITFPSWLAPFMNNIHLSPIGLIEKKDKNPRLIVDHSFDNPIKGLHDPKRICPVNKFHWITTEIKLAYGTAFINHLTRIYNLRITYPNQIIFLFDDDIVAAFRHSKYNLFVAGAFSFIANDLLVIPPAQTFGSTTSPSNYEALAQARAWLSTAFSCDAFSHLQVTYKEYLTKILWDTSKHTSPKAITAKCIACDINKGVLINDTPTNTSHFPYVDDTLICDIKGRIEQSMAASLDSGFTIFGAWNDAARPCAISLEKLFQTMCSPIRTQLGIVVNTNHMTISLPQTKIQKLAHLLKPFHDNRHRMSLIEGAELLGNLDHIGGVIPWFRHIYVGIRESFNSILHNANINVHNSAEYIDAVKAIDQYHGDERLNYLRFVAKQKYKILYHSGEANKKLNISIPFRNDINLISTLATDEELWITPIPHLIPREHPFTAHCDSCQQGAGGYSESLGFLWYIQWPKKNYMIEEMLNDDTHINIYEYLSILITYSIASSIVESQPSITSETYPTINIFSDNSSAVAWSKKGISSSNPIAKQIGRLACSLQLNNNLGLHVSHIEGERNVVADCISRLFTNVPFTDTLFCEKLQSITQEHPILKACKHYHPPPKILSTVMLLLSDKSDRLTIRWQKIEGRLTPVSNSTSTG
jgi:hypothetical protein